MENYEYYPVCESCTNHDDTKPCCLDGNNMTTTSPNPVNALQQQLMLQFAEDNESSHLSESDAIEDTLEDFLGSLDEQDCFFIPLKENVEEVIVKVGDMGYYLWRENYDLMELVPVAIEIEE